MSDTDKDELRPEYDLSKLGKGVRGKCAKRHKERSNVVVIDPVSALQFCPWPIPPQPSEPAIAAESLPSGRVSPRRPDQTAAEY